MTSRVARVPDPHPDLEREARTVRQLLGIVQEADTPEQRDGAWDEIEARFADAEQRIEELRKYAEYMAAKNATSTWDLAMRVHFVELARDALDKSAEREDEHGYAEYLQESRDMEAWKEEKEWRSR